MKAKSTSDKSAMPEPPSEAAVQCSALLSGTSIGTNTLVLRRLKEIVPLDEWEHFQTTDAFHRSVIAAHQGVAWMLRKLNGKWVCAT